MKYIFPRQFGLHNVFSSAVSIAETAQRFKDYTIREREISNKRNEKDSKTGLPKRLRGELPTLISKLRRRHNQCPYVELLHHYCPTGGHQDNSMPVAQQSSISLATPAAHVSAFARVVISRVVPNRLWGSGGEGDENKQTIMRSIDRFIRFRRFESISLHAVLQGIKVGVSSPSIPVWY